MLKTELRLADDAIRGEERAIAGEKKIIARLESAGHPIELAVRSLRAMERTLASYRHHRRILLRRIGLYSRMD
jgi:hypothetical protein